MTAHSYTTLDVRDHAYAARDAIADADHNDDHLTQAGANYLADLFAAMPREVRSYVWHELDGKPGQWNYEDSQGREYHWLLRQWRNRYQQSFQQAMNADNTEAP